MIYMLKHPCYVTTVVQVVDRRIATKPRGLYSQINLS